MSFFAPFSEHEKDLFRTASSLMELPRGNYLMRRGEPGGDVFLVEEGSLEVVDRRATPEVILAVLRPGAVVGEMAYLEDTPRSAELPRCARPGSGSSKHERVNSIGSTPC